MLSRRRRRFFYSYVLKTYFPIEKSSEFLDLVVGEELKGGMGAESGGPGGPRAQKKNGPPRGGPPRILAEKTGPLGPGGPASGTPVQHWLMVFLVLREGIMKKTFSIMVILL